MIDNGKISKKDLIEALYILLICLNISAAVLGSSNITELVFISKAWFCSVINKFSVFLFFGLFCFEEKLKRSKLYIMMALSIAVIAITLMSHNRSFAIIYTAILAFPEGISLKKIAKWQSYTFMFFICVVVFMYYMGWIESNIFLRNDVSRNSCGFTTANAFGNTVILWMIPYVYYKFDKWKIRNTISCLIIAFVVFSFANNRMSFIMEMLFILIVQIKKFRKTSNKVGIYRLSSLMFPFCMFFSFIITYFYDKGYFLEVLSPLNAFVSYRLGFMQRYYHNYGVKLFGQEIETVSYAKQLATGEAWSGIDNSYIYILISWGIVIVVVFCVMYFLIGKYLEAEQDYIGALCVVILCVVGVTESYLSNIAYNFSILLIARMFNSGLLTDFGRIKNNRLFKKTISQKI